MHDVGKLPFVTVVTMDDGLINEEKGRIYSSHKSLWNQSR
ncbi:hypothetical protein HMPREF3034_02314 [Prevotella sp. DNF00663]|nr:hypothetical protein HMPREF3034_02314 [Prevotella sp. DNF00663]